MINQATPTKYHTTKKMKNDAESFVSEQKELSKELDTQKED